MGRLQSVSQRDGSSAMNQHLRQEILRSIGSIGNGVAPKAKVTVFSGPDLPTVRQHHWKRTDNWGYFLDMVANAKTGTLD